MNAWSGFRLLMNVVNWINCCCLRDSLIVIQLNLSLIQRHRRMNIRRGQNELKREEEFIFLHFSPLVPHHHRVWAHLNKQNPLSENNISNCAVCAVQLCCYWVVICIIGQINSKQQWMRAKSSRYEAYPRVHDLPSRAQQSAPLNMKPTISNIVFLITIKHRFAMNSRQILSRCA